MAPNYMHQLGYCAMSCALGLCAGGHMSVYNSIHALQFFIYLPVIKHCQGKSPHLYGFFPIRGSIYWWFSIATFDCQRAPSPVTLRMSAFIQEDSSQGLEHSRIRYNSDIGMNPKIAFLHANGGFGTSFHLQLPSSTLGPPGHLGTGTYHCPAWLGTSHHGPEDTTRARNPGAWWFLSVPGWGNTPKNWRSSILDRSSFLTISGIVLLSAEGEWP